MGGVPFVVQQPGDYSQRVLSGSFDCVLGDRERAVGTYREFIFFHDNSVYPEYVVLYRRHFDEPSETAPVLGATRSSARSASVARASTASARPSTTILGAPMQKI